MGCVSLPRTSVVDPLAAFEVEVNYYDSPVDSIHHPSLEGKPAKSRTRSCRMKCQWSIDVMPVSVTCFKPIVRLAGVDGIERFRARSRPMSLYRMS